MTHRCLLSCVHRTLFRLTPVPSFVLFLCNDCIIVYVCVCVFPKVVRTLWSHAGKYLVLVESGNPQGFALVQEARDIILGIGSHRDDNPTTATTNSKPSRYGKATSHRGKKHPKNKGGGIGGRAMPKVHGNRSGGGGSDAHVLAPCPGDAKCPRVGTSKPCHFPIRVRLKALHAASCVCRVQLAGCYLLAVPSAAL